MSHSLASMPPLHSHTRHVDPTPNGTMQSLASTKLNINALLNPSSDNSQHNAAFFPDSPASIKRGTQTPPSPQSPATPPAATRAKRQKLVKDGAVFERGPLKGPNNYPPYECTESSPILTPEQSHELALQHRRFQIFPSGNRSADDGLISDFPRRIPYSSDKKSFLNKTGRDVFDVFQYKFTVPDKPGQEWTVMWDYTVGLVRITPFFKACGYSKTIPAKALSTNIGLKELSHSITGGALAAQGYWVPFACARAICLTFCWDIRWALTPIFGPSFIKECIPRGTDEYGRFKIDSEVVRCATLEAESWKTGPSSRDGTPANPYGQQAIPRSTPANVAANQPFPSHLSKPSFKAGSPFDEEYYTHSRPQIESPALSPKSQRPTLAPVTSGWTSINNSPVPEPRFPTPATPTGMIPLNHSLLNEPRHSPTTSWRAAERFDAREMAPTAMPAWSPEGARTRTRKRRSTVVANKPNYTEPASSPPASEESNDLESCRPAPPVSKKRKISPVSKDTDEGRKHWRGPSKFTAEDAAAARLLMNLNAADAHFASGPNVIRDAQKRRRLGAE